MILGLILLLCLFIPGIRYVRRSFQSLANHNLSGSDELPLGSPRVALIVPAAGNTPGMKVYLESLLNQDYPNYETIFVTRDIREPAASLIKELLIGDKKVKHIIAGQTNKCAQKNQNLLAGVKAISPSVEILIFCDSTHLAPPNLISNLVKNIITGDADMTSVYHRIIPGDSRLATLGMVWTVLGMHLLQGNKMFTQPWGGATAISREAFEMHHVYRLWAKTVVDDVSLASFIKKAGIKFKLVSTVCLATPLSNQTFSIWISWLKRQLLYVKFYLPLAWAASAMGIYLLVSPVLLSLFVIGGGFLGIFNWTMPILGVGFLTLLTGLGLLARRLIGVPLPLLNSMIAFYVTHFILSWCYLKTCFTNILTWKGISYRVNFAGEVMGIVSEN